MKLFISSCVGDGVTFTSSYILSSFSLMIDPCISKGISIQTGPGRPEVAIVYAFSNSNKISFLSLTIVAYLVIGLTVETISNS